MKTFFHSVVPALCLVAGAVNAATEVCQLEPTDDEELSNVTMTLFKLGGTEDVHSILVTYDTRRGDDNLYDTLPYLFSNYEGRWEFTPNSDEYWYFFEQVVRSDIVAITIREKDGDFSQVERFRVKECMEE